MCYRIRLQGFFFPRTVCCPLQQMTAQLSDYSHRTELRIQWQLYIYNEEAVVVVQSGQCTRFQFYRYVEATQLFMKLKAGTELFEWCLACVRQGSVSFVLSMCAWNTGVHRSRCKPVSLCLLFYILGKAFTCGLQAGQLRVYRRHTWHCFHARQFDGR